jgi:hypothetical protein
LSLDTTDDSGEFVIQGLDRSARYDLIAAGAGWAANAVVYGASPEGATVEIPVYPVFGAWMELHDARGEVFLPNRVYSAGSDRREDFVPEADATMLQPDSWVTKLAGDAVKPNSRSNGRLLLCLARDREGDAVVLPLRITLKYPGCLPSAVRLDLEPAVGSVPQFDVELVSEMRRQTVRVVTDAPPHLLTPEAKDEIVGQLAIEVPGAAPWYCVVYGRDLPVIDLAGIPRSVRRIQFLPAGWPHLPPESFPVVDLGEEPALNQPSSSMRSGKLALAQYGSIRYEVGAVSPRSADVLSMNLTVSKPSEKDAFVSRSWSGASIAVHCLPPGAYEVRAEYAIGVDTIESDLLPVVVRPGAEAQVHDGARK